MVMDRLDSTWETRDYPTLLAAARILDTSAHSVLAEEIAEDITRDCGLSVEDVTHALIALGEGGYLTVTRELVVSGVTERGRRAVGLWPSDDDSVDALAEVLLQAAEQTDDPEDKTRLRKAGEAVAGLSHNVAEGLIKAWIMRHTGLG
jgi:DNA-binding transcriptional ArsR family regulator